MGCAGDLHGGCEHRGLFDFLGTGVEGLGVEVGMGVAVPELVVVVDGDGSCTNADGREAVISAAGEDSVGDVPPRSEERR